MAQSPSEFDNWSRGQETAHCYGTRRFLSCLQEPANGP